MCLLKHRCCCYQGHRLVLRDLAVLQALGLGVVVVVLYMLVLCVLVLPLCLCVCVRSVVICFASSRPPRRNGRRSGSPASPA